MPENDPLLVGITGGIGTGKSTICKIFIALGIPIYDADTRAKWLISNDISIKQGLVEAFGEEVYKNNALDRDYLGKVVFQNPDKLKILNAITHPAVGKDFEDWVSSHSKYPYLIKEAALLIEAGSYKQMDKLILVTAPQQTRVERVLQRDKHRTKEDVINVMKRQMPEEEKEKYCDYIIENDGNTPVLPIVLSLDQEFRDRHFT